VDYPPIVADAGPDQEFSCLENLMVTPNVEGGSGEYTYEWIVNGESVSLEEILNYSTDDAGTATVIVTDECLETATDEMQFSFPPVPVLVDLGDDFDVTCLDISSLDANSSGGIGNYTYQWQVDGQDAATGNPFEIQIDTETTISVSVTDACENVGTDEITVKCSSCSC
jgi:hypothetical protein